MKARVMIAEDERLAREELAYLIQQEEDFLLCPSAENGTHFLDLYREYRPDIVFLDIHMPGLSGMDAAKALYSQSDARPLVVFTTAYDEYAVEAFGVEAVDYLLKPYDTARFKIAIARVRKQLATGRPQDESGAVNSTMFKNPVSRHAKLLIDDGEKTIVIPVQNIQYAVRAERGIIIHTKDEKVKTRWSLQELESKLTDFRFFRPHRSYLVNLNDVHEITPWVNGAYTIVLNNKEHTKIPVSRLAVKTLFQLFEQWNVQDASITTFRAGISTSDA